MGKVKRLELWWQLYRTSLPVWDLENFRPTDFFVGQSVRILPILQACTISVLCSWRPVSQFFSHGTQRRNGWQLRFVFWKIGAWLHAYVLVIVFWLFYSHKIACDVIHIHRITIHILFVSTIHAIGCWENAGERARRAHRRWRPNLRHCLPQARPGCWRLDEWALMKLLLALFSPDRLSSVFITVQDSIMARVLWNPYTGCPRRNVQYFGRVFLMLNYTDITQNTYIQSWMVTEIMAREKCGHLAFPRSIRLQLYREPPLPVVIWLLAERTLASFTAHELHPTR